MGESYQYFCVFAANVWHHKRVNEGQAIQVMQRSIAAIIERLDRQRVQLPDKLQSLEAWWIVPQDLNSSVVPLNMNDLSSNRFVRRPNSHAMDENVAPSLRRAAIARWRSVGGGDRIGTLSTAIEANHHRIEIISRR